MITLLIFLATIWLGWTFLKGGFWLMGSFVKITFKLIGLFIWLSICFIIGAPILLAGLIMAGMVGMLFSRVE